MNWTCVEKGARNLISSEASWVCNIMVTIMTAIYGVLDEDQAVG
jgi:hypothetical protein